MRFVLFRWLPQCESGRPLQRKIPCYPETGMGTLLHRVARLGRPVREKHFVHFFTARFCFWGLHLDTVLGAVDWDCCGTTFTVLPVSECHFLCGFRVKRFVAMKVVKSAEHYTETAVDEIKLLRSVSSMHTEGFYALGSTITVHKWWRWGRHISW